MLLGLQCLHLQRYIIFNSTSFNNGVNYGLEVKVLGTHTLEKLLSQNDADDE
jgi:hypothetical protein